MTKKTQTNEWMSESACKGSNPDVFYPEQIVEKISTPLIRSAEYETLKESASEICFSCSVQKSCLLQAISEHEQYGIWGGLNTSERKNWARRNRNKMDTAVITRREPINGSHSFISV